MELQTLPWLGRHTYAYEAGMSSFFPCLPSHCPVAHLSIISLNCKPFGADTCLLGLCQAPHPLMPLTNAAAIGCCRIHPEFPLLCLFLALGAKASRFSFAA